jgi:hypothetical protein
VPDSSNTRWTACEPGIRASENPSSRDSVEVEQVGQPPGVDEVELPQVDDQMPQPVVPNPDSPRPQDRRGVDVKLADGSHRGSRMVARGFASEVVFARRGCGRA